jgi:glycosyltransferase involved in cell wall biosynthesis
MAKQTRSPVEKVVKMASKVVKQSEKTSNTIKVKNAEGDPDTTANILVQNKIDYTPRVSVVIPVYNAEKYLAQCLDSILHQTLKEIEIICVDDGSTDKSLEILKEYAQRDKRITILGQKNLYAGVARNAGLSVARGEYLSFLDSDDFFESDMLAEMYTKSMDLDLDICVCNADIYDEKDKQHQVAPWLLNVGLIPQNKNVFNKYDLGSNVYKFTTPAVWNKIYKRDFVLKHKLLFQNLSTCNDIGMGISAISFADRIGIVDKVFVHYRCNSNVQISHTRNKSAINIIHAYNYIKRNLNDKGLTGLQQYLNELLKENVKYELGFCSSKEKQQFYKQAKQIMKGDNNMLKRENFIVHFIRHIAKVFDSKIGCLWRFPVCTYEKYHKLKDKIREIKKSK